MSATYPCDMIRSQTTNRILLIDEQPVCYLGLNRILERNSGFEIALYAKSIAESVTAKTVDLIVLDISAAKGKGIAAIKEIKQRLRDIPLLVLTSHDESLFAERCLKSGANGFIMKTAENQIILDALETVSEGAIYVSDHVKSLMLRRLSNTPSSDVYSGFERLSDRELLVVEQIGLSKNNKEIARELQISVKTIESHRSRIKAKLRLGSPQELMRYAMRLHHA